MPAMVTCWGKVRWNVGSDDFTLPALVAVFVRLVSIGFLVGVLIYLFVGPEGCEEEEDIPPFLYGSLFGLLGLLFVAILNETILFSISLRGSITHNADRRKTLPYWLFARIFLIIVEFIWAIVCLVAVFGPGPYAANALQCPEYHDGPLVFAKVVVVLLLATILIYFLGFAFYLDPLGLLCSTSMWQDLESLHSEIAAADPSNDEADEPTVYAKESRLGRLHRSHIGYGRIFRKLRGLLCCLNTNGNRSRATAMHEMALAFHTVFSDEDRVASDLVAGLILLSNHQKKMKEACAKRGDLEGQYLHREASKVIFENMPDEHKPPPEDDFKPPGHKLRKSMQQFDPHNEGELELLNELVYYMEYAMGIYGWPLHVFNDLCCGPCQICAVTCCACTYRRWHSMARLDPELGYARVQEDNCCMCGLGTIRLQSNLPESHVFHVSYQNEVFQAPFSICVDHSKQVIVLTVRGTLSIKDALTDLSVSMDQMDVNDRNPKVKGSQFVHKGMYLTAKKILAELRDKDLLKRAMDDPAHQGYQLVLSGHSLGAGVVSVLSVILQKDYPNLKCYAFSPPGCIFSFPLSYYSRKFITSVVLGNDMIPRVTIQSLFYLKEQMKDLTDKCRRSKFQVLFRPRFIEHLPRPLLNCCFKDAGEKEADMEIHNRIGDKICSDDSAIKTKKGFAEAVHQAKGLGKQRHRKADRKGWKKLKKAVFRGNHLHGFVRGMQDQEQIAAFPPGNIVHIKIEFSKKPWLFHLCYPDKLTPLHVAAEDLSVIIVDRGMVDDHLPNNVLNALKRCRKEFLKERRREERGVARQAGGGVPKEPKGRQNVYKVSETAFREEEAGDRFDPTRDGANSLNAVTEEPKANGQTVESEGNGYIEDSVGIELEREREGGNNLQVEVSIEVSANDLDVV